MNVLFQNSPKIQSQHRPQLMVSCWKPSLAYHGSGALFRELVVADGFIGNRVTFVGMVHGWIR